MRHWDDGNGQPLCGKNTRTPTTDDYRELTCKTCRKELFRRNGGTVRHERETGRLITAEEAK